MFKPNQDKTLFLLLFFLAAPAANAQDLISRVIGPDGFGFVVFLTLVLIVIFVPLYFAGKREQRRNALYLQFLERDKEIPAELLPRSASRRSSRQRDIVRGVWLACIAVGLGLVLYVFTSEWRVAVWALIPLFLSAASFINAWLLDSDAAAGNQSASSE